MSTLNIRPEVREFARRMEKVLRENDHKGGWKNCDVLWLLGRLEQEVRELKRAIGESGFASQITREACDVANFAMMIDDLYGER